MSNKVVCILDDFANVDDVLQVLNRYDSKSIFPISLSAYQTLKSLDIEFELPDNFLTPADYQMIDETAIRIGETWWNSPSLSSILVHNSINLGSMFEWELILSLVKFVHKIVLVDKILETVRPQLVVTGVSKSIESNIPRYVSQLRKFQTVEIPVKDEKNGNFSLDYIEVSIDLLSHNIPVRLPRKLFNTTKAVYDRIWDALYFLNEGSRARVNGKNLLLLDYNLVTYFPILRRLSESDLNLMMFNDRRPLIWNMESFRNAKKIKLKKLEKNEYITDCYEHSKLIQKFIAAIQKDEEIKACFSVNSLSFWDLVKDHFLEFCKHRFKEILEINSFTNNLLNKEIIDLIVSWNDVLQSEKMIISIAKQKGIKTLVLQHGLFGLTKDPERRWHTYDFSKLLADKMAIWGTQTREIFQHYGIEQSRLVDAGCPRYDDLFQRRVSNEKGMILLATSGLPTRFSYFSSVQFLVEYEEKIRSVCKAIKKLCPEKKLVLKLHPFAEEVLDVAKIVKSEIPEASVIRNANMYDLLSKCELLIAPSSSVVLEALILSKPVVLIQLLKYHGVPFSEYEAVVPVDSPTDAELAISKAVCDDNTKRRLAEGRKRFLEYCLTYQGNSSIRIGEIIQELLSGEVGR